MVYEPMEQSAENIIYVYAVIIFFSWIMTFLLFKRWNERKKLPTKLMFFTFVAYSVAISVLVIGYLEMYITGYKMEIYKFSLGFGYCLMLIANMLLVYFAAEVFSVEKKYIWKYLIINSILAVLVLLPQNYYGVPSTEIGPDNIRAYTAVGLVVWSIFTHARIANAAYKVARSTEDKIAKQGFKWIGHSQLSFIFFFILMATDTVYFTITGGDGYTVFVYISWLFAALFYLFSYFGLIMPPWLRKRYES